MASLHNMLHSVSSVVDDEDTFEICFSFQFVWFVLEGFCTWAINISPYMTTLPMIQRREVVVVVQHTKALVGSFALFPTLIYLIGVCIFRICALLNSENDFDRCWWTFLAVHFWVYFNDNNSPFGWAITRTTNPTTLPLRNRIDSRIDRMGSAGGDGGDWLAPHSSTA